MKKEKSTVEERTVNPDELCQKALQAKMAVYQAKEHFEAVLKGYNDQMDTLINVIGLMKQRILQLEKPSEDKKNIK